MINELNKYKNVLKFLYSSKIVKINIQYPDLLHAYIFVSLLYENKAEVTTSCLSPVTFGSTTGLLLAIIVALFTVVVLQCVWLRKNNGMTWVTSKYAYLSKSSQWDIFYVLIDIQNTKLSLWCLGYIQVFKNTVFS